MIKDLQFIATVKANINKKSKGASEDYAVVRGSKVQHIGQNDVRQDTLIYRGVHAGTVQFLKSRRTGKVEVVVHRANEVHVGRAVWDAIEEAYRSDDASFRVSRRVN